MTDTGNTTTLAADLVAAMSHLAEALMRENAALTDGGHDALRAAVDEKIAACRAYETKVKTLREGITDGAAIDPQLSGQLRRFGERVAALAAENERQVRAARAANQRLVETIAEAARAASAGPGTYSRTGAIGGRRGGCALPSVVVAIDRAL